MHSWRGQEKLYIYEIFYRFSFRDLVWLYYIYSSCLFNPLNAELNPICHLLALLGVHQILHVRRIRVNPLFDTHKLRTLTLYDLSGNILHFPHFARSSVQYWQSAMFVVKSIQQFIQHSCIL